MDNAMLDRSLAHWLDSCSTGKPTDVGSVTLVPILGTAGPDADLLEEALAAGTATVSEIGAGQVNTVRVCHRGSRPLLIIDGEEIVGAKQNRVFNASFLVGPNEIVDVPVSCVERGRWAYNKPAFGSPARTLTSTARGQKLSRVAASVTRSGSYDADQGAVWRDVDELLAKSNVHSGTASFSDAVESRLNDVDEAVSGVNVLPDQVGIAVIRGPHLVSMDLLGTPALFRRAWRKIARGVFAEQYGQSIPAPAAAQIVTSALSAIATALPMARESPGCGQTVHAIVGNVAIGAVLHRGSAYHVFVSQHAR
jgi:hypothetical protein